MTNLDDLPADIKLAISEHFCQRFGIDPIPTIGDTITDAIGNQWVLMSFHDNHPGWLEVLDKGSYDRARTKGAPLTAQPGAWMFYPDILELHIRSTAVLSDPDKLIEFVTEFSEVMKTKGIDIVSMFGG